MVIYNQGSKLENRTCLSVTGGHLLQTFYVDILLKQWQPQPGK